GARGGGRGAGGAGQEGRFRVGAGGGGEEAPARGRRGGEGRAGPARGGHEDLRQRRGRACLLPAGPGRAGRAVLDRGDEHVVVAARVGEQERLFLGHRTGGEHRVLLALGGEDRRRRAPRAGGDPVPPGRRARRPPPAPPVPAHA